MVYFAPKEGFSDDLRQTLIPSSEDAKQRDFAGAAKQVTPCLKIGSQDPMLVHKREETQYLVHDERAKRKKLRFSSFFMGGYPTDRPCLATKPDPDWPMRFERY